MTLDGAAWMAIFVVFGAFLCVTAYIFETHEPDPISGDRRHQAHPATRSGQNDLAGPGSRVAETLSARSGSPVVDLPPESAAAG